MKINQEKYVDNRGGSRGRVQGVRTPAPLRWPAVFSYNWYSAKKTVWFIGVEVEQETSEPLLKKILDPPLDNVIMVK